jgi:MinD superfamily P-loop ATPase
LVELVILSGKGGTGKTSLTAAFVDLISKHDSSLKLIVIDADVDAANLDLVLSAKRGTKQKFWGGSFAAIDTEICQGCGTCTDVCRFDAVDLIDGDYQIDPIRCEGCAACYYQCPVGAISLHPQLAGEWYRSEIKTGCFLHACLEPAQENSGKLVALLKEQARELETEEKFDMALIDGPPGTGCPVIAALSGSDAALIVTEPSVSGIHDLHRALASTNHFGIKSYICINKYDIHPAGTAQIHNLGRAENIKIMGEIPFDLAVPRAMMKGRPVTEIFPDNPVSLAIESLWMNLYRESSNWSQTSQEIIGIQE